MPSTFFKWGLLLLCVIQFSCTKENSVIVEEKEIPFITEVNLKINNQTITTDAFAGFCSSANKEFFAISNKEVLIDTVIQTTNFEENDFLFYSRVLEDGSMFSLGGAAFGESITGIPGLQIVFTDSELIIDSNDGQIVSGSMQSDFIGWDPVSGALIDLPFSVSFTAVISPKPEFCN